MKTVCNTDIENMETFGFIAHYEPDDENERYVVTYQTIVSYDEAGGRRDDFPKNMKGKEIMLNMYRKGIDIIEETGRKNLDTMEENIRELYNDRI